VPTSNGDRFIIGECQRERCRQLLQAVWEDKLQTMPDLTDLKVQLIGANVMDALLSFDDGRSETYNPTARQDLLDLVKDCREQSIVLRATRGPVAGAIKFHIDGHVCHSPIYAIAQVTLVDDTTYKGGRICFFNEEQGFAIPERPAGFTTIHGRACMHGVTRLTEGERQSLFVIRADASLGDDQVVKPSQADVARFLEPAQASVHVPLQVADQGSSEAAAPVDDY
jgi:hypothetical protein